MLPSILSLLTYAAFASAIEPATNYENSALLSALDQASAGPSKTVIGGFANLSSLGIPALNTLFSNTTLDPNCQTDGGPCITSLNVGASKFSVDNACYRNSTLSIEENIYVNGIHLADICICYNDNPNPNPVGTCNATCTVPAYEICDGNAKKCYCPDSNSTAPASTPSQGASGVSSVASVIVAGASSVASAVASSASSVPSGASSVPSGASAVNSVASAVASNLSGGGGASASASGSAPASAPSSAPSTAPDTSTTTTPVVTPSTPSGQTCIQICVPTSDVCPVAGGSFTASYTETVTTTSH